MSPGEGSTGSRQQATGRASPREGARAQVCRRQVAGVSGAGAMGRPRALVRAPGRRPAWLYSCFAFSVILTRF
jgi:hypothetical protein